jgi:hypothetical protein
MKRIKAGLVGGVLALALSVALALPTEQQVQAEASQGHYAQAEQMMKEVVTARPGSAKAHYIYAELLAHNGKFSAASDEARQAQQLDSSLSFTDPEKFRSFQQLLANEQGRSSGGNRESRAAPARSAADTGFLPAASDTGRGGVPNWVWLIAVLGVGAVLWRGFARSRAAGQAEQASMGGGVSPGQQMPGYGTGQGGVAPMNSPMNAPMGQQPSYGAPYGQPPMQQPMARPGSGMLGTGLAVGAGVAGGMLLDEMLHRREGGSVLPGQSNQSLGNSPMWGPGPTSLPDDDPYAQQLEERPIDFGNGNDWDSNSAGGDIDMGSSGSDDDWT